jgi:hypothetical protein
MKKLLVGLMMVAMGLLLMTPLANAYPVEVGDQITINSGFGNANGGGAFFITGGTSPFYSFCLEMNEHISYGGSYYVGSIMDGAINGGAGGQTSLNYDPISSETAYLYSQWSNYYGNTEVAELANIANALQLAIWKFEGEWSNALTPLAQKFYDEAAKINHGGNLYGVQVLNLYNSKNCEATGAACQYTGFAQDQLVKHQVPEPATILLFGLGLLGLAGFRRKIKK